MERRNFLGGIGLGSFTLAAAAATSKIGLIHSAVAAETKGKPSHKLADTAADCATKGEACTQHCLDMMASGDTSMAACAKSTYEMTAACETLARMARANSPHLKAMAKVAMDVCKSCEDECRKHADKMPVCKSCADACAACYDHCKSVSA